VAAGLIRVRPARVSDLPRILAIYNREVLHSTATYDTVPRTPSEHARWYAGHGPAYPVFVVVEGRRVLGWASLGPWSDRPAYKPAVETSVYVEEKSRGRGVGKALLAALLEAARARGHHAVLARISAENTASVRLHASAGFVVAGTLREVGVKFGRVLDVSIMELLLP
jgi:L-amino acid N-acyltransferase